MQSCLVHEYIVCLKNNLFYCRYPSLRVAYVEEKEEIMANKTQKVYSSILVKAVNGFDQVMKLSLDQPL